MAWGGCNGKTIVSECWVHFLASLSSGFCLQLLEQQHCAFWKKSYQIFNNWQLYIDLWGDAYHWLAQQQLSRAMRHVLLALHLSFSIMVSWIPSCMQAQPSCSCLKPNVYSREELAMNELRNAAVFLAFWSYIFIVQTWCGTFSQIWIHVISWHLSAWRVKGWDWWFSGHPWPLLCPKSACQWLQGLVPIIIQKPGFGLLDLHAKAYV